MRSLHSGDDLARLFDHTIMQKFKKWRFKSDNVYRSICIQQFSYGYWRGYRDTWDTQKKIHNVWTRKRRQIKGKICIDIHWESFYMPFKRFNVTVKHLNYFSFSYRVRPSLGLLVQDFNFPLVGFTVYFAKVTTQSVLVLALQFIFQRWWNI